MYKFTKKIVNSRKHSGSFAYYTTSLEQNFKGVTTTMQMAVVTGLSFSPMLFEGDMWVLQQMVVFRSEKYGCKVI